MLFNQQSVLLLNSFIWEDQYHLEFVITIVQKSPTLYHLHWYKTETDFFVAPSCQRFPHKDKVSNIRMVFFSKTEKKLISQQTRKGPYVMMFTLEGGIYIEWCSFTCLQISLVLNKRFIVYFYGWEGWGVTKLVIFCGRHKCTTPKWFKITTNLIIRGSNFLFNIKSKARYVLTA